MRQSISVASAVLFLTLTLFCQSSLPSASGAVSTSSSGNPASTRSLLISARAKDGPVAELTAADLEVKEEGKPVQIQQVRKVGRLPLRYCVLFDSSNSERDRFKLQQDTAVRLLQRVVRPGTDHGRLGLFADEYVESNETDNPASITDNIGSALPGGGTALYDAITTCARHFAEGPAASFLRVMFVFSDGVDNASRMSPVGTIDAALLARIRIYAIGQDNERDSKGTSFLKKLSETTGGRFFAPARPKGADKAAAELNYDLQNSFEVTYVSGSSTSDNRSRSIEVKCTRKGVTVFAPKRVY